MLEIKTIIENSSRAFDAAVNKAITTGWELVRRECFITGSDRATTFYAELERFAVEVEETDEAYTSAEWLVSRDPHYPYKCSSCGCKSHEPISSCPHCHKTMTREE